MLIYYPILLSPAVTKILGKEQHMVTFHHATDHGKILSNVNLAATKALFLNMTCLNRLVGLEETVFFYSLDLADALGKRFARRRVAIFL